jgi:VWFA-related protein
MVRVDASVIDGQGRPVENLTAADFTLEVDGRPRRLLSAQYVPYRTAKVEEGAPADPAVASNEHVATGRVILVAVDQGNIRRLEGRAALKAAAAFIDALDPADRVAAVAVDDVTPIHFTSDRLLVKRVLNMLTGRIVPLAHEYNIGISEALAIGDGSRTRLSQTVTRECGESLWRIESPARVAEAEGMKDPCPMRIEQQARLMANNARSQGEQSVDAIRRLLRRLGDIEGPKTLVLLSEGLIAEPQVIDMTEVATLAQQARVTIYVLQLDAPVADATDQLISPTVGDDVRIRGDGLARIAGAGGGALFQLVGTDPHPFNRIMQELSGYYLLAFEPSGSDRDGRPHRISVSTRTGNTVRARPHFSVPPPATAPLTTEDRLVQLLRTRRLSTELPLRVGTHTARASGGPGLRTVVTIETGILDQDVTFGMVVVDAGGVVATSATERSTSGTISIPLALQAGQYTLRAAGIDAGGRTGSIERPLDVRLPQSASVATSELALLIPADRRGAPARPLVERTSADTIVASAEIYADRSWKPAAAMTFAIAAGADPAAVSGMPADLQWSDKGFWQVSAALPLTSLKPGRYLVTLKMDGAELTRSFMLAR